jgi:uncharacterized delta-60 repeat protein
LRRLKPAAERLEDRTLLALGLPIGSPDLNFNGIGLNTTLVGSNDSVQAATLQADGKIVVAGSIGKSGGSQIGVLVRYLPSGRLDTGFGGPAQPGTVALGAGSTINSVAAVAIDQSPGSPGEGDIVVAGRASAGNLALARLRPDGSLDSTFGTAGVAVDSRGPTATGVVLAIQPDDKIVVEGPGSFDQAFVERFNADGTPDPSFGTGGLAHPFGNRTAYYSAMTQDPHGNILLALVDQHDFLLGKSSSTTIAVARLTADGRPDPTFGSQGIVTTTVQGTRVPGFVVGLGIDQSGRIMVAGDAATRGPRRSILDTGFWVACYDHAGNLDPSFHRDPLFHRGAVEFVSFHAAGQSFIGAAAVAVQPDGKVLLGGATFRLQGSEQSNFVLARLNRDGTSDESFGQGGLDIGSQVSGDLQSVLVQPDGNIVTAFTYVKGTLPSVSEVGVARYMGNVGAFPPNSGTLPAGNYQENFVSAGGPTRPTLNSSPVFQHFLWYNLQPSTDALHAASGQGWDLEKDPTGGHFALHEAAANGNPAALDAITFPKLRPDVHVGLASVVVAAIQPARVTFVGANGVYTVGVPAHATQTAVAGESSVLQGTPRNPTLELGPIREIILDSQSAYFYNLKALVIPSSGPLDDFVTAAPGTSTPIDVLDYATGGAAAAGLQEPLELVAPPGRPSLPGAQTVMSATNSNGFDLRLMSWGDGSGVPTSGNNLVVVGIDGNGLLHIRIYDAAGNRITDTDETKLPASQAAAVATLKQQLPGLLPPHVLTDVEMVEVIGEATVIVGQSRPNDIVYTNTVVAQPGQHPTDSFTYTVQDANGRTATGTVYVTIDTPPVVHITMDPPAEVDGPGWAVPMGTPGPLTGQISLSDAEGDPVRLVLSDGPQHGTLKLTKVSDAQYSFSYVPLTTDIAFDDRFTVRVSDLSSAQNVYTSTDYAVAFRVGGRLQESVLTGPGTSRAIDVLDYATGEANLLGLQVPLELVAPLGQPNLPGSQTAISATNPNDIVYSNTVTPRPGQHPTDSFTYTVQDANLKTVTGTVYITIDAWPVFDVTVNHPAMEEADGWAFPHGTPGPLTGMINITDAEDDPLTLTVSDQPLHGTLNLTKVSANQYSFSYDPPTTYAYDLITGVTAPVSVINGDDQFSLSASDGFFSTYNTIVFHVPNYLAPQTAAIQPRTEAVRSQFVVPENVGDSYYSHGDVPDKYYQPALDFPGLVHFAAPGVLWNQTDFEGFREIPGAATQIELDPLRAELATPPQDGLLYLYPDGSFNYTPKKNFTGTDVFAFYASDGYQRSEPTYVDIHVVPGTAQEPLANAPVLRDVHYFLSAHEDARLEPPVFYFSTWAVSPGPSYPVEKLLIRPAELDHIFLDRGKIQKTGVLQISAFDLTSSLYLQVDNPQHLAYKHDVSLFYDSAKNELFLGRTDNGGAAWALNLRKIQFGTRGAVDVSMTLATANARGWLSNFATVVVRVTASAVYG